MSRTNRGSKPLGYDYWGKRPHSGCGYGKHIKDMTHRSERMLSKEILLKEDTDNDSTDDHKWIVNWFKKNRGVDISIMAQHPFELDVIFNSVTMEWLGYVSDYCFIHDDMYCDVCYEDWLNNYEYKMKTYVR